METGMALAFGVEFDPEEMSAPRFIPGFAPTARPGGIAMAEWAGAARDWLARPALRAGARPTAEASPETIRLENADIANAFARIADIVGLAPHERAALFGVQRDPSRVILALETLGAALDLCGAPEATLAWLRAGIAEAPFNGRAPLTLFAAEGQFGVEIALLYLRARLRKAGSARA